MTDLELLAREIVRLDSRGGSDTETEPSYSPDEWPSEPAVRIALRILADRDHVASRHPWLGAAPPRMTWRTV